jgi:hypothetical protein
MMSSARRPARLARLLVATGLAALALALGLSVAVGALDSGFLLYLLAFNSFLLVGGFVAARRPENAIGWQFCGAGLITNVALLLQEYALLDAGRLPAAGWVAVLSHPIQASAWLLVFTSLLLFPTGRPLTPRWGVWIRVNALVFLSGSVVETLAAPDIPLTTTSVPNPLYNAGLAPYGLALQGLSGWLLVGGLVLEAILRFRRAARVERLQLAWFTYCAAAWLATDVAVSAAQGPLRLPQRLLDGYGVVGVLVLAVVVALTILRYRLYDIELIIRRTLIYGALTALLAGVYFGGVALAQALLRPFTGAGNDLAIVVTTLGIAALVLPLRRAVQRFIDRRFYRGKYNAARTLAAFSAHARDEVELDVLTARLLAVVDETMQPAAVSLWLRPPAVESPWWRV